MKQNVNQLNFNAAALNPLWLALSRERARVEGSLSPTEWWTLAVEGKSKRKKEKGNVGERPEPTFCQRRRLLELKPGKQGKPRLSSAWRANNKKEAEMFRDNPCGFRSARWGDDETCRNSGVITRSCHCCSFHAIVMSRSKRKASPCFSSAVMRGCTALKRSLIYFSSEVRLMEILFFAPTATPFLNESFFCSLRINNFYNCDLILIQP